ncbi:MAG: hypothetical protein HY817_05465 [Candidatus Abawacabacteria bacterium]|nr:hypothetical protein [Candidatus Abawacabacteria bacterium]
MIRFDIPTRDLLNEVDIGFYNALYQNVLFHGTGRLHWGYAGGDKSHPNGQLIDILTAVANEGIKPQADHIARLLLRSAETVSLTRQRIYARCYGEFFGSDDQGSTDLAYVFGSMEGWQPYFFGETSRAMKSRVNAPYLPTAFKHLLTRFSLADIRRVMDVKHHTARWLVNRATIQGNHPVVFGVEIDAVTCLPLPHGLNFFESRTAKVIPPESVKLIEVPLSKIAEVKTITARSNLRHAVVLPIEHGEVHSFRRGIAACTKRSG